VWKKKRIYNNNVSNVEAHTLEKINASCNKKWIYGASGILRNFVKVMWNHEHAMPYKLHAVF